MQENQRFEYDGREYKTRAHGHAMIKIGRLLAAKTAPALPPRAPAAPADVEVLPDSIGALQARLITRGQAEALRDVQLMMRGLAEGMRNINIRLALSGLGLRPLDMFELSLLAERIDRITAEAAEAAAKLKTPAVREDARELGLIKAINDKRKEAKK